MSPLTTAERLALAALAAAWVVPAWWLGAATVSAQWTAAGLGAFALAAAVLARRSAPEGRHLPPALHRPMATFAILAFLGLLLCQALNPDRVLVPGRPVGELQPIAHLAWLPAGIAGPFDQLPRDHLYYANAWRHLLVAAATLAPLAALAALPRRAAIVRAVLAILFLHGVAFSAFAFAHNLSGSKAVLWLVTDANFHLGAPQFLGKNQQAAYQVLLLAAALGAWFAPAAFRPWNTARRRDLWLGLGTLVVLLGTATTRSRAGLAATACLLVVVAFTQLWPRRHLLFANRRLLRGCAVASVAALALLALLPPVRTTLGRVGELAHAPADLLFGGSHRRILHAIAWQMTLDRPWFGHGAGCYLLLFTGYHPQVPAYMEAIRRHNPDTHRIAVTHADGDWVEFTAEYGLVGTALLATPWLAWLGALRRLRPLAAAVPPLAAGPALVLLHGWVDFVLRNPAILGLAAALAVLSIRLARLSVPSRSLSA